MIRKLLFIILAIAPMWVMAQDDQKNVGGMVIRLDQVKFSDPILAPKAETNPKAKELIDNICALTRTTITEAIEFSRRFTITDMEAAKRLDEEMTNSDMAFNMTPEELQKKLHDNAVEIFASDWVMDVNITQCKFTPRAGGKAYDAFVNFSITLKDRITSHVITTESFSTNPADITVHKLTMLEATGEALESMKGVVREAKKITFKPGGLAYFFANQFDIYANYLGMEGNLYKIGAGALQGVDENTTFKMVLMQFDEQAKKFNETPVAECKVDKLGPNTSLCKITKGEKQFAEALGQKGAIRLTSLLKKVIKEIKLKD